MHRCCSRLAWPLLYLLADCCRARNSLQHHTGGRYGPRRQIQPHPKMELRKPTEWRWLLPLHHLMRRCLQVRCHSGCHAPLVRCAWNKCGSDDLKLCLGLTKCQHGRLRARLRIVGQYRGIEFSQLPCGGSICRITEPARIPRHGVLGSKGEVRAHSQWSHRFIRWRSQFGIVVVTTGHADRQNSYNPAGRQGLQEEVEILCETSLEAFASLHIAFQNRPATVPCCRFWRCGLCRATRPHARHQRHHSQRLQYPSRLHLLQSPPPAHHAAALSALRRAANLRW